MFTRKHRLVMGLAFATLLLCTGKAYSQKFPATDNRGIYKANELKASPRLSSILFDLRRYISANDLQFFVANTAVSEFKLQEILGEADVDSVEMLTLEFKFNTSPLSDDSMMLDGVNKILNCTYQSVTFDLRNSNIVPDVRYQSCSNCWAYSAIGVIETSHILINRIQNPALVNLSEKQIVSCSPAGNCQGGLAYKAFIYLKKTGTSLMNESHAPDDGTDKPCPPIPSSSTVQLQSWGVVDPSGDINRIAPVEKIKEALCRYGAVATSMNATPLFQHYAGGVFFEQPSNYQNPTSNHAVIIIGWDDNKQAWLVRNSWSNGWGENGYCWIKYNSNNIGRRATWVITKRINTAL